MKSKAAIFAIYAFFGLFQVTFAKTQEVCRLKSPDGHNVISVFLNDSGRPLYRVERRGSTLISDSPLGLRCNDQDFSQHMTLHEADIQTSRQEKYQLLAGNKLQVDTNLTQRCLTLKNSQGSFLTIELAASNEGVGFRYRFADNESLRVIVDEATGFQIPPSATGWLEPYHVAGKYTPAYEDFYFRITSGDLPPVSREKPRGWCLPGLFEVAAAQSWMLIAESGTDGAYCACHLANDPSSKGLYKIALAYEDEVTAAKSFHADAKPVPVTTRTTPWRVIILGDEAKDILNSTLITDLAPPSQIDDTSWIEPGRASWSWWSHPDNKGSDALYNQFTDLAAAFGWEYTLFDAGWWNADLDAICRYAHNKGVKPLIWTHAMDFYDADKRNRKLDDWVSKGIKGIKVDFWCSDRQETMAAIHDTLKEAAKRKLVVSLHGCTIPRGWHRTWPNLLTAEAVLGTECYFYEERYPAKAAELNTLLPFTRNVLAPMDTTPVALTIRKFPRKTTAAHELAAALVFNSGTIHYADSVEVFNGFPDEVKAVLRDAPAAWDETICLVGEPGRTVVLARRTGRQWMIAGLNGTDQPVPVRLDGQSFGMPAGAVEITEGNDPLMEFSIRKLPDNSAWQHQIPPFGGFILIPVCYNEKNMIPDRKSSKGGMQMIDLKGQWDLVEKGGDIKAKGQLPGDVHSALLAAGIIEDPYYGDNETKVQWVSDKDWIFKRTFDVSPDFLAFEDIYLDVDGPDTFCTFRINDSVAGTSDDMFLRYRFDIKPYLKPGANSIEILFESPRKKAAELLTVYGDEFPGAACTDKGFNLIRKVQSHGGWDWGIKIPSCGIAEAIHIVATDMPRIEHVYTDQNFTGDQCDVAVTVELDAKKSGKGSLTMEFDGQAKQVPYDCQPGLNTAQAKFTVSRPKLWWPAGYGSQPLYDLKVSMGNQHISKKIGLRTVQFICRDDANGRSMFFRVNGKDVFCKGANWIPCDAMANRQTPEKFEHLLDSTVKANMNMLRVWGGGYYEKDLFYELCDRKGILVFQDMMFSCSLYPVDKKFLDTVKKEITYQAKRLKSYACIVLWSGDNECLNYALNWFSGSDEKNKLNKANWLKLNEARKQAYMEADGTRAYWPSSPGNGLESYDDQFDDFKRGDTHNWEVWHGQKPLEHYYTIQPRFISEFGFQSFPSMESIQSFAAADQQAPESEVMKIHQKNGNGNTNITNTFKLYFHEPKDFESMVYLSQLQQALAIKTGSEYWRSIKPVCQGILYWQLNDNWPVCSWSSIENNGNWKQLHYQAKRFFEPVISCVIKQESGYNLYGISDLLSPVDLAIQLSIYDLDGHPVGNLKWEKNIAAQSSVKIAELTASDLPLEPGQCFAILSTEYTVNHQKAQHTETVLFTEPKNYHFARADVAARIQSQKDSFRITLTAAGPAMYVTLETPAIPGVFSDNSFAVVPGSEKVVTFFPKNACSEEALKKVLKITHLRQTY